MRKRENRGRKSQAARDQIQHDEAFKKLLEVFFKEFIELFFPDLDQMLDYSETRFLMQELLVDVVGSTSRSLDLLIETKWKSLDIYILIQLEPQAYKDPEFHERMFIYFSRLFERHRKKHRLIIPIAIFTGGNMTEQTDFVQMGIPGHTILQFQFLKVELQSHSWRKFIDSDNPVAAALLAKMKYNKKERRELRLHYLRMLLRLRHKLDEARLALVMSIADLYYEPDLSEDRMILEQLSEQYAEEGEELMKLMPAWSKWAYEEGVEKGIEKGMEQGIEKGIEKGLEQGRKEVIIKLADKGFTPEQIADLIEASADDIRKLLEP